MLTHLRQRFWTATVSARRSGLTVSTIHNRLRKKQTISSVRTAHKKSDNDETVSTGTGFRSVAKPDLHSAMLVVKRTNKRCWDCYVLQRDRFGGGSFVVWGGKIGDQKTYFVVMQDNFNALYRRHLVTISPLYLHIKN